MSGRTWLMMLRILAINWGGFAVCLAIGVLRGEGPDADGDTR